MNLKMSGVVRRADKIPRNDCSIPKYWFQLNSIKNALNQPRFKLLSNLFTHLAILPHSSACVERVFSQVNCVKTKKTNRLTVESVRNRLLAKQAVTKYGNTTGTWNPSASLVSDVVNGACSQRYKQRQAKIQQENSVTVTVFPLPSLSIDSGIQS